MINIYSNTDIFSLQWCDTDSLHENAQNQSQTDIHSAVDAFGLPYTALYYSSTSFVSRLSVYI